MNREWERSYRINFKNCPSYSEYYKTKEEAIKSACKRFDKLIPKELQQVIDDKWTTIGIFSK